MTSMCGASHEEMSGKETGLCPLLWETQF